MDDHSEDSKPHLTARRGYLWYVHLPDKSTTDGWSLARKLAGKGEIIGHVGTYGEFPQVIGLALLTPNNERPAMSDGLICEPMRLSNQQGRVHQADKGTWLLDRILKDEGGRVYAEIWFGNQREAVQAGLGMQGELKE